MTNLFYEPGGPEKRLNSLRKTHIAGFSVMDFNMCPFSAVRPTVGRRLGALFYEYRQDARLEWSSAVAPAYPKPQPGTSLRDEGCEQNRLLSG